MTNVRLIAGVPCVSLATVDGSAHEPSFRTNMARDPSGRIVVELEPALKKRLHATLTLDGITLKAWVREQAESYLTGHEGLAKEPAPDKTGTRRQSDRELG